MPSRLLLPSWLTGLLAAAVIAVGTLPAGTHAATLPAAVGGQPMPSLAPMLTRVTPAVVNISSTTHVPVRDAYFDDPMVRQFFGLPATPRERRTDRTIPASVGQIPVTLGRVLWGLGSYRLPA